jgi:hypothetical protein
MWTLIRNGGIPPMLFILVTGILGLAAAFHFALRARRQSLGFIKQMAAATLFGTLAASCADVGGTLYAAEKSLDEGNTYDAPPGTALRTMRAIWWSRDSPSRPAQAFSASPSSRSRRCSSPSDVAASTSARARPENSPVLWVSG